MCLLFPPAAQGTWLLKDCKSRLVPVLGRSVEWKLGPWHLLCCLPFTPSLAYKQVSWRTVSLKVALKGNGGRRRTLWEWGGLELWTHIHLCLVFWAPLGKSPFFSFLGGSEHGGGNLGEQKVFGAGT